MVIQPKQMIVIAVLAISGSSWGQTLTAFQIEYATTGDASRSAKSSSDLNTEGQRIFCFDTLDLLVHDANQFLVVAPAKDTPTLVVDLAGGEVTELSVQSVAVFTHWSIFVGGADGQKICVVDTKSHRQATAH